MGKKLNITDEERLQRRRAHQRKYNKTRNSPAVLMRQSEKDRKRRLAAGAEPQQHIQNNIANTTSVQQHAQPLFHQTTGLPRYGLSGSVDSASSNLLLLYPNHLQLYYHHFMYSVQCGNWCYCKCQYFP